MLDSGVRGKKVHGLPSMRTSKGTSRGDIDTDLHAVRVCLLTLKRLLLWI